jgi:hypothetical protein
MLIARRAALIAAVFFFVIVAFQVALAAGAPWGRAAYGGQVEQPGVELRISSVVAIVIWTAAALIVLKRVGFAIWAPLPRKALPVAVWVLFVVMLFSALLNAITPSAIERAIWLPVAIVVASSLATVAIASRRAERAAR